MQPIPAAVEPAAAQAAAAPKNPPSSFTNCCQGMFALIFTLILVIGVVSCTVVFAVLLSRQSNDVSTQMVVFTGRRTRDWTTANSYSMHSFEEDQYFRFYVCMKSAGIQVPGNPDTIGNYKDAVKQKHDCSPESDRGWPKDIGFLRCIQKHFEVSFHQSNMFLQCLELTEGVMVENVQTDASTLFLGSYNYVAMLLTAMGVMAGFLIFTAGGYYISSEIKSGTDGVQEQLAEQSEEQLAEEPESQEKAYMRFYRNANLQNIKQGLKQHVKIEPGYNYVSSAWMWVPLAAVPNSLAFVWSVAMFLACMFYTYPIKDTWSDTVSINDGASVFPGTPWTGNLCSGVSFLMGVYFLLCLVEWYRDSKLKKSDDRIKKLMEEVEQEKAKKAAREAAQQAAAGRSSSGNIPGSYKFPVAPEYGSPDVPGAIDPWDPYGGLPLRKKFNIFPHQTKKVLLGTRYNPQLYYAGTEDMSLRMTPPLNKVYALEWVFVDGLLFVGMINSQNSPLNENVVAIWFFIIMCRAFQFAATYFLDDVLFSRYTSPYFLKAWNSRSRKEGTVSDGSKNSSNKLNRWVKQHESENGLGVNMDYKSKHFISFGEADRMAINPFIVFNNTSNPKYPDNATRSEVIDSYVSEPLGKIYNHAIHAGIVVVSCHLASLWCMITVIYHFANAISIPSNLSIAGVPTSVHVIQICFISFMLAMDLVKHAYVFTTVLGWIDQHSFWYFMTITNTAEWVFRAVFIICMIFPTTLYFGDMAKGLNDYVTTVIA